jgi:hypothetical protein
MSGDKNYPQETPEPRKTDTPCPQIRTITHDDEVASWSRSKNLMGTTLLPSSDDSDFFRSPSRTRTVIMMDQHPLIRTA